MSDDSKKQWGEHPVKRIPMIPRIPPVPDINKGRTRQKALVKALRSK